MNAFLAENVEIRCSLLGQGPYTVPNYDLFGHHHHSKPFKAHFSFKPTYNREDKSHLVEKDVCAPATQKT